MEQKKLFLSATAALIIGAAQTYFLLWAWAEITVHSPLVGWLLHLGLRGGVFYAIVALSDTLTAVVLSVPAAYLLLLLRPKKLRLYTLLAVLLSFVWLNRGLPGATTPLPWGHVLLGWVPELLALPAAVCLVHFISGASNKSFKPNPLRGSA